MRQRVDYYFALHSPWTYLGHERFRQIARTHDAEINALPVDLGGRVFPVSGGLPLAKRAPQRQAYRLLEMRRHAVHLGLPINVQPTFFPVDSDDAARLVVAVNVRDGTDAALDIAGAILRALWAEQRNIADAQVLAAVIAECGLPARRLDDSFSQAVHDLYEDDSARAIKAGVFGAPSYVIDGEIFWGQDRLDFVDRKLAGRKP